MDEIIGALNESPSLSVRRLVGELVNHSQLQRLRPSVTHQRVCNTSNNSQSHATSVEEEIRHAFRGSSNLQRPHFYRPPVAGGSGKKKSACSEKKNLKKATSSKKYTKTVILVNEKMSRLPTDKRDLHANGRVASCVKLETGMSAQEIYKIMKDLFADKFESSCTEPWFKYMKGDRNRLFTPKTPADTVWDGAMVKQLAGNGNIYIMATHPLKDDYVSTKFQDFFEVITIIKLS